MGVLLQAFFKLPPGRAVPSPADGDPAIPWWWDHLARQAANLRDAGFTALWLPPVLKTSAGAKPGADGYGPFDDYDIGSKNQMGSVPTRFGTREQLQRCVAILRANGMDVYLDLVEHHRSGDPGNFIFRYRGADGTPNLGRFPKDPLNFRPNVPQDPHLGGAPRDDVPFGRELCPINGKPAGYVFKNLVAAAAWLTRGLDIQGYRLDDVKGLSTDFLLPFLNSEALAGKFAVGEFFDGNRLLVNGWIFNPQGMQGRPSAFDFPLKFLISSMCNNPGRFNMADLDHAGLVGISPLNAVTFVENHDTDLKPTQSPVILNKILGYALILTSEGYPCVYYRDYSTDKDCFGLKPSIDNLIWIHEKLASGPTAPRWKDFNVFAYERLGGPRLLVGLNNDPAGPRTIRVATGFGAQVRLHDYTGHAPDLTTEGDGAVTLTIPRNDNGFGYVCYSRDGQGGGFGPPSRSVTQQFEGAPDLDLLPASGEGIVVQRVWCEAGSPLRAVLAADTAGWTADTTLTLDVLDPDGVRLASKVFAINVPPGSALDVKSQKPGFHALRLTAANTPATNAAPPYTLSVTYLATRALGPGPAAVPDPALQGRWARPFALPNVAIHAHVLPNGKLLFWGRRDKPTDSLDPHNCTPFVWDPATGVATATPSPTLLDASGVNLFCSGHTFLPDGRLFVIGGHLADTHGSDQASIYDPDKNTWTPTAQMNGGRWYPTAVTLPDGSVLASSGSSADGTLNQVPQIWQDGIWHSIAILKNLPLYPRMHVEPRGRIFMSGPLAESHFLDTTGAGQWTPLDNNQNGSRANGFRDYAPSVIYDDDKVLFVGGGNNRDTQQPTNAAETIDLSAPTPAWRPTGAMHFPRRQHNATILADGTVLVTGGTRGGGGPNNGFNDLTPGQPVHVAELWDPATGEWTELAAEDVDRCYHATAVLLPDATVLSAGGGEYRPDNVHDNAPEDTHRDAQIFSPPYLFRGPRPEILSAPDRISYGQSFAIVTPQPDQIGRVTWIRLPSVTHSFDQNQRINILKFASDVGKLIVTAPPNANVCPPGHYMLFVLSHAGVPSVAKIVRIQAAPGPAAAVARRVAIPVVASSADFEAIAKDAAVRAAAKGTAVLVGITPTCPYGISACWGGAYEALQHLQGVDLVRPIPSAKDSTAFVYLKDHGVPDVEKWRDDFARTANGTYLFRGVEVTLKGAIEARNGDLLLLGNNDRPPIRLAPLQPSDRIQWNHRDGALWPLEVDEDTAFGRVATRLKAGGGRLEATVTGPLKTIAGDFVLHVRKFQ